MTLPPGQQARDDFPGFGKSPSGLRFPKDSRDRVVEVFGDAGSAFAGDVMEGLSRCEQVSDFHCVTTWSVKSLRWSGVRFADFAARHGKGANWAVLRGQDSYRTEMRIDDLSAPDVLIADRLDGQPLTIAHGAPLRIVAPAHYGYKSVKHLDRIEFWINEPKRKPSLFAFMDHPRARVALEERGKFFPGRLLRYVYRPLIGPVVRKFEREMARGVAQQGTTGL